MEDPCCPYQTGRGAWEGVDPWAQAPHWVSEASGLVLATPAATVNHVVVVEVHKRAYWLAAVDPESTAASTCAVKFLNDRFPSSTPTGKQPASMQHSFLPMGASIHAAISLTVPEYPLTSPHVKHTCTSPMHKLSSQPKKIQYLLQLVLPLLLGEAPLPLGLLSHLLMTHSLLWPCTPLLCRGTHGWHTPLHLRLSLGSIVWLHMYLSSGHTI